MTAKEYPIRLSDGQQLTVLGNPIKVKGQKVQVLAVRKYSGKYDHTFYAIDHIPTGALVGAGFAYLSLARKIAYEILLVCDPIKIASAHVPVAISSMPPQLADYVGFFRAKEVKEPPSFEDFISGPEYEHIISQRSRDEVLRRQEQEHLQQLHEGNHSLGWIPGGGE